MKKKTIFWKCAIMMIIVCSSKMKKKMKSLDKFVTKSKILFDIVNKYVKQECRNVKNYNWFFDLLDDINEKRWNKIKILFKWFNNREKNDLY